MRFKYIQIKVGYTCSLQLMVKPMHLEIKKRASNWLQNHPPWFRSAYDYSTFMLKLHVIKYSIIEFNYVAGCSYHISVSKVATYAITQTAEVSNEVPTSKINTNFYNQTKRKPLKQSKTVHG